MIAVTHIPIHPATGGGIYGWILVAFAAASLAFARRRYVHIHRVTNSVMSHAGRRHNTQLHRMWVGRLMMRVLLYIFWLVMAYEFAAPIITLIILGLLAGKLMSRGLTGTLTVTFIAGAVALVSILVVGHLIWVGALLAWILELHRNLHVAFTRPAQPAIAPLPDASSQAVPPHVPQPPPKEAK